MYNYSHLREDIFKIKSCERRGEDDENIPCADLPYQISEYRTG